MKKLFLKPLCIITAAVVLMLSSCAPTTPAVSDRDTTPADTSDPNEVETPEVKRAIKFGEAARLGNDMYLHSGTSTSYDNGHTNKLVLSDYGAESFEVYMACFDPACTHGTTTAPVTCLADCVYYRLTPTIANFSGESNWYKRRLTSFAATGSTEDPEIVMYTMSSLYLSKPFSNQKTKLVDGSNLQPINISNPLLYDGYVYYLLTEESKTTQWRMALSGGEPERVFDYENIRLIDIIDGKYYFESYNNSFEMSGLLRANLDMTRQEALPDYWKTSIPFYIDGEYGYIAVGGDVYKFNNSDLSQEPELIFSVAEELALEGSTVFKTLTNGSVVHYIYEDDSRNVSYTDAYGTKHSYQEFDTIIYGSYDAVTGEKVTIDLKTERLIATNQFIYADSDYLYLKVRDKAMVEHAMEVQENVNIAGKLCRITLDGMKYEFIE